MQMNNILTPEGKFGVDFLKKNCFGVGGQWGVIEVEEGQVTCIR